MGLGALAALAVAGCGGDEGLKKADLAKKANAICKKYAEEGKKLGQPDLSDPAKAEEYFQKAADLAAKQQDELADLKPVDSLKSDYDKLVNVSQDATDLLGDLASAAGDKDREQGAKLIQDLTKTSQELDDAATAVGATDCTS
jgi:vacuolar-type H+-ATPase subunit I/STV1